jgi:Ni2+-binding GTPase involved in maturation of urease and hydrogenase
MKEKVNDVMSNKRKNYFKKVKPRLHQSENYLTNKDDIFRLSNVDIEKKKDELTPNQRYQMLIQHDEEQRQALEKEIQSRSKVFI